MKRLFHFVLATVAAAAVAALSTTAPAAASCVGSPSPSPHRFTGAVTSVQRDGLIAHVRTDDGRDVVVRGTPVDNENGFTSVDRHFSAGVRYEFHPLNNASPFEDNACTATHAIGGSASTTASGAPSAVWKVGGGLLLVAGLVAGGWWLVRRRSIPSHQGADGSALN